MGNQSTTEGEVVLTFRLDKNHQRRLAPGWKYDFKTTPKAACPHDRNQPFDCRPIRWYNLQINLNLMSLFTDLPQRTKLLIVASAMFLITLSMGLLVFGTNIISDENSFYGTAKSSTRADMLYIQPTEGGH